MDLKNVLHETGVGNAKKVEKLNNIIEKKDKRFYKMEK